jgi:hypothetical protein
VKRIEELWSRHVQASFPPRCRGKEIKGIDLVLIDADTAGCVSTFLERNGHLDQCRLAILGLCYHHLGLVVAGLKGEGRDYFSRLEELAGLVLSAVRDSSKRE